MKKFILSSAIIAIGCVVGGLAHAQDKIHTITVPFGAGGSTDLTARIVAEKIIPVLKTSVVVENKPGAGTILAATAVKDQAADGTKMLLTVTATAAIVPYIYEKVGYNFTTDYTPVAQISKTQVALIVPEKSPFKTLGDLIKHGKENKNSLNVGISSVGTMSHLTLYRLGKSVGMETTAVPFRGGSTVLNDLLAGHIDAAVDSVGEYIESHQSKKVRILAVFGDGRVPNIPEVPNASELGVQGIRAESWMGVFVPSKTSPAVVKQLQDAIAVAAKDPATKSRLEKFAIQTEFKDSGTFATSIQKEIAYWSAIVRESGIKPQ